MQAELFDEVEISRDAVAERLQLDQTALQRDRQVGELLDTPSAAHLPSPHLQPTRRNVADKLRLGSDNVHHSQDSLVQRWLILPPKQGQQLVPNPVALDLEESIAAVFAERNFSFGGEGAQGGLRLVK